MAAENFERIMEEIFRHEGGYVDHPRDPGGATNMGITIGTLRDHRRTTVTKADVRALSKEEAMEIYRKRYWDVVCGDELPPGVDFCAMDSAVNSGPSRGARWLQRAVGVQVDGKVGTRTIAAADAADPVVTVQRMCDDRLNFLRGLGTWSTFGRGWARRVESVRAEALALARDGVVDVPEPAPAPIGHNGGPPIEEPAVVTGGARAKANGAGLGVLIVGPALALMAKFGWIPEAVATDPESVIQLTALLLAAAAYAGAWFAPRNANAGA